MEARDSGRGLERSVPIGLWAVLAAGLWQAYAHWIIRWLRAHVL
jgi:hypothetical protein